MSFGANRLRPASAGKRWIVTVPKRSDHSKRSGSLARDAIAWVVRLNSGDATIADAERLLKWRARSSAHESAFREAVKSWRAIGSALDELGHGGSLRRQDRPRRKTPP
ncbi:DUF4880 domain-containing protein [Bradyrhizobium sp. INPA01-394B]|uniref:DUF4880 domain-containing protein n=1 Tax=Bradyrhizobium campsiandrae TaxID=1729892 RepID=A0ABR7U9M0_9BRAD|nr:DUF4880 domain-containing protein [Bradyrhizobium campsiandrae]MBC9879642.1 DUF4880 domain-containing protein [Bradyrhizobium campsiandrae]MBC9980753.1 DUF4880 domain-containing protein [Bradyrhizobium campsiandrae]